MRLHVFVLVSLPLCYHQGAAIGLEWATGFLVDNAKEVGVPLPGYMALLSNKSTFLTNLFHYLFGNKYEERFKNDLHKHLPESAPMEDVSDDNEEKMTFRNGVMHGLNSIAVTENTDIQIIWNNQGFPVATVSVNFSKLRIEANIRTYFNYRIKEVKINGPVVMKFMDNNFVLKFRLHPGIFQGCFLKLYDVICTDMDELSWDIKDTKGKDSKMGEWAMQEYFTSTEGAVENHIKTSVANILYQNIPKASWKICNNKKLLRLSQYQTVHKKHSEKDVEKERKEDLQQPQTSDKKDPEKS